MLDVPRLGEFNRKPACMGLVLSDRKFSSAWNLIRTTNPVIMCGIDVDHEDGEDESEYDEESEEEIEEEDEEDEY